MNKYTLIQVQLILKKKKKNDWKTIMQANTIKQQIRKISYMYIATKISYLYIATKISYLYIATKISYLYIATKISYLYIATKISYLYNDSNYDYICVCMLYIST